MQQQDDFNFWLGECRNYGLRVTRDRLIKSLHEFDDFAYQFAMSPDSKEDDGSVGKGGVQ